MKRYLLPGFIAMVIAMPAMTQNNPAVQAEFPGKSPRLAAAIQGYFTYPGRFGVSVDGKLMFRANANKEVYNEFVITGKATHTPSINGGNFFSAFDGKKYNNISSLTALAGYRINFGLPRHLSTNIDAIGGGFIELNAGASYTHHIDDYYYETSVNNETPVAYKTKRTWAPSFSGVAGYSVSKHLDIIVSYTGAWPAHSKGKVLLSLAGAGIQYNF
ncbi:MAG: hypothetical protein KF746_07295 [Chitinophagaceae bacterium]|nr:hypothetical protein [Chitinophagaceae bacterium]